jgi:hypothetical protein
MTEKKQRACSGPPKSKSRPYDNRPGPGTGRVSRRQPDDERVRLILPEEPPLLTPEAARALLRILAKARARQQEHTGQEGAAT